MQPSAIEVVVADAGPLIALARLDALQLLGKLFRRAWVAESVVSECLARPDRPEGASIHAAVASGLLVPRAALSAPAEWKLGQGETDSIALALEIGAGLLIDDRSGRQVAEGLGLATVGVLGVLVRAKRKGHLQLVGPLADSLVVSGYFLAGKVIDDARRLAGEN